MVPFANHPQLQMFLLVLQIVLVVCFLFTLVRVIFDFFHGSLLILSGLLLIVVGYTLKLAARMRILLLCRRIPLRRRRHS